MTQTRDQKLVGPVVRGMDEELVDALFEAIEKDNPGAEIFYEDRQAYVRIHIANCCRVTRKSLEEVLGRSFELASLEPAMSSFAGRMKYVGDDELIWYLEREDV